MAPSSDATSTLPLRMARATEKARSLQRPALPSSGILHWTRVEPALGQWWGVCQGCGAISLPANTRAEVERWDCPYELADLQAWTNYRTFLEHQVRAATVNGVVR